MPKFVLPVNARALTNAVTLGLLTICCGSLAEPDRCLAQTTQQWTEARKAMVDMDLVANGIKHRGVLAAMRGTPRHEFVPVNLRKQAYYDMSLPIGHHQTISPPFVVATMTEQLDPKPTDKVLEVGTGSGFQSAVLSGLVKEIYTIEIIEPLGQEAAERLKRLGYHNVKTKVGDGYLGWAEHAPFDKIIVTCSPENVPQPLVDQLREGGRMLIPLGERYQQTLYLMKKQKGKMVSQALEPTFFVPMTGTADDMRSGQSDSPLSELVNNGFESHALFADKPDGWYYVRQARLDGTTMSGHGQLCLTFTNTEPGRGSQALQGVSIDGRQIQSIDVNAWVRCQNVRAGQSRDQLPRILVNYFDEDRAPVGQEVLGPWDGSFPWTKKSTRVSVPPKARIAIIAIGLLGATGEVSLDDVEVRAATDLAQRPRPPINVVDGPRQAVNPRR